MSQNAAPPDLSQLSSAQKRELLSQLLAQKTPQTFPLSSAQRRLWFLDQLQLHSSAYVLPAVLRLSGTVDISRLEHCLNQILQRHESLRTSFVTIAGAPRQQVISTQFSWMSSPDVDIAESDVPRIIQAFIMKGFDLNQAPLLRAQLLRLESPDASEHLLLLAVHHIVADYRSLRLLFQEIIQLYQERDLAPLQIQYVDYAVWQENDRDRHDLQRRYWQTKLADAPTGLPILPDFSRSALPSSEGAVKTFALSARLSEQLRQLSRQENATLFMTLLAAFKVLVYRYSGQSDLLVGSTIDQRHQPELQPLIGLFVNNLVFRSTVNPFDSFQTYLAKIRQVSVEAYTHRDLPFEELIEHLAIERHLNQNPLFQIAFVLHSGVETINSIQLPHLQLSYVPQQQKTSRFDLSLDLDDRPSGLTGQFEYRTDLFAESTIDRLIQHFEQVLMAIVAEPTIAIARIPLQTSAELQQLDRWNQTAQAIPYTHLLERFDQVVETRPTNLAITDSSTTLSYAELNTQANALANYLVQQGIQPSDRVGICLGRSVQLLVALIAVLKTGATYVPLDPSYPVDRLTFIATDAELSYLLTDSSPAWDAVDGTEHDAWINRSISSQDTAYIIYTSGSTGQPKGVQVLHQGLINILWDMQQRFGLTENDRWLAVTTIAFDIAALELFLPLMVGAQVVIADRAQDAQAIVHQLENQAITCMQATPATWRMLLEMPWSGHPDLQIFSGGEALDRDLAQQLRSRCGRLWNLYGPTETTIWSGVYQIDDINQFNQATVPIGAPITNTQFYVFDQDRQPVGIGIPGELYIGGEGLAQGYWQRSDLTTARFIDGPEGNRLYATGDRVRRLSDGNLEYLGRLDFQVKLRGYRIELGEIEACIIAHPQVAQVIVALVGDGDHQRLVAYYQANEQESNSIESAVAEFLRSRLPAYMMPSQFVHLVTMPLTKNGKVDRRALPVPRLQSVLSTPPQTATEIQLAGIWRDLLAIEQVNCQDDFFALGGHSLLATRLIAQVQQVFQVDLSLQQFFTAPQLELVAQAIDRAATKSTPESFDIPQLEPGTIPPLSFAQQRFWLLNQLEPDSATYHIPIVLKLTGKLDINQLRSSFIQLIDRHAVLRTNFVYSNLPIVQSVIVETAFDFQAITVTSAIEPQVQAWITQPFNLTQDPPLRVRLLSLSPQEHILTIVLHHIAADAWSINLLLGELAQAYRNLPLPDLPIQYADFAAWQRDWLNADRTAEHLAYWQQQLADAPTSLNLATDRPRTAISQSPAQIQEFAFSPAITDRLQQYCREQGVTLFMLLVASYGLLLLRYTDNAEVLIGSSIANRSRAELEPLLGCFVNTLVLRVDGRDNPTVTTFLQRIKAMTIGAYAHQDLPFEQLLDALQPDRSLTQNPIFQTMLVLQNAPTSSFLTNRSTVTDLTWEAVEAPPMQAKFDLLLTYTETVSGLGGKLEYDRDLFQPETIDRLIQHLQKLIIEIIDQPDQPIASLSILSANEIQQFKEWNQTQTDYALQPIHQMFEAQAVRTPDRAALIDGAIQLSYAELNAQANQLAHQIQVQGMNGASETTIETTIGILLERKAPMLIAVLAVLKSGAAYVPIDPAYPLDRIQYLLVDANLSGLITQTSLSSLLSNTLDMPKIVWDEVTIDHHPCTNLPHQTNIEDLAYLIYTSGSTGQPKGVEITHRNAATFLNWAGEVFAPPMLQGMLASTSLCFDLSIFELFLPLTIGGCIILAENALALPMLPAANQVTVINTVPSVMQAMLQQAMLDPINFALPSSVRIVNLAGEALPQSLVEQLYQLPQIERVYNLYGPSEATTYATYTLLPRPEAISAQSPPTIGRPITNTRTYILDSEQNPVPIGIPGELYLAGDGLARGYWGKPELTAAFIQLEGERRYRTGDRARFLRNGEIEYLGRLDDQIKVRGFRIELGEIVTCLESHPSVVKAMAIWRDDRVMGYYQLKPFAQNSLNPTELRQFLASKLPSAFIPAHLIELPQFPLTPNGKVDRAALPMPELRQNDLTNLATPSTETETQLLAIWQKLLNQSSISIHDNFFELGGDSILVLQMVAYARQQGLSFTPRQLFQQPTIAQLASIPSINTATELIDQSPIVGNIALAPIQQWFFQQDLAAAHHWNQTLLFTVPTSIAPTQLEPIVRALLHHHDVLRSRFNQTATGWQQTIIAPDAVELETLPIAYFDLSSAINAPAKLTKISTKLQASLSLNQAPLLQIGYFHWLDATTNQRHDRLLLVFHHLIIDGLSWRILLEDWQTAHQQLERGQPINLPAKTTAYGDWTQQLQLYQPDPIALAYWHPEAWQTIVPLPIDDPHNPNTVADLGMATVQLSALETQNLLQVAPRAYQTQINDLLLTALAMTLRTWTGRNHCAIELEGHGRDSLSASLDLSRTIGWFTSLFPIRLDLEHHQAPGELIKSVKEQLRQVPSQGIDYGISRYLNPRSTMVLNPASIRFNYLGQTDATLNASGFQPAPESAGASRSSTGKRDHPIEVNALIIKGQLRLDWSYSQKQYQATTIATLAQQYLTHLAMLIQHCLNPDSGGYTPSDFPDMDFSQTELDDFLDTL